ncbi:hypothetical protein LCGC14_0436850 [marine sediment metagenome]|uniref:Uncharacterized protein n=1 Tax=marine sediment metagenome TaxID=412755 RepID=A0A0F9V8K7_9ZZZZ
MIAYETLRAVALRVRGNSITLNIAGHGIKKCAATDDAVAEARHWVGFALEVSGMAARCGKGHLVFFTVQSITVLRESEWPSASVLE